MGVVNVNINFASALLTKIELIVAIKASIHRGNSTIEI
jgi:hypothetical protein